MARVSTLEILPAAALFLIGNNVASECDAGSAALWVSPRANSMPRMENPAYLFRVRGPKAIPKYAVSNNPAAIKGQKKARSSL